MKTCAKSMSTWQVSTGYGRLAKNARTASATFAPTTAASSSRVARRTPARLPNVVSSVRRRRGPIPGTSIELRSQIAHRPRAAMERHGEAVRFVADPLQQQQRGIVGGRARSDRRGRACTAALLSSRCRRRRDSRAPALRAPRTPPTAGPCRRRSAPDPETGRPARAACGSGAARPRASRRSRSGRTRCAGIADLQVRGRSA